MPKERVTSTTSNLDVDVAWAKDCGYVQVATTCGDFARAVEVAKGILEAAKANPANELLTTGYYADLDRRACNDLIRNLKRARDGAFGRDE